MNILRTLPKIDKLVLNEKFIDLNTNLITKITREIIASLREDLLAKKISQIDEEKILEDILKKYKEKTSNSLIPLINATGVIIHTNLGRSPLDESLFEEAKKIACGYSNLEFNLENGKRGERYEHVSSQLCTLLDAEDILVVNNNAAAVFLILNTFGKNKKTIVSRGELVEIGGSFRIPDVMRESGSILKEVGTTNKTKLKDYENAIGKKTALLMKVHRSNFAIKGFSEEVGYEQIIKLAKKKHLIDYFDVGGAYAEDLPHNIKDEHLDLKHILSLNPSLVSFSGDKLLGSVQCGIIIGKKHLIGKLKQNQLLRMLRVDKVTLGLLGATIKAYLEGKYELIPTLNLLKRSEDDLEKMCLDVSKNLPKQSYEIIKASSYVGGGTMPDRLIPSIGLHIKGDAKKLQDIFRKNGIIGRIEKEKFILDFRSILPQNLNQLNKILKNIL